MIRDAWRAWVALWDRREAATPQALVRIAIGLCVVADLAQARWLGVVQAVWAPPPHGLGYGASDRLWAVRWWGATPETAELLWTIAFVAILLFTIGLATRLAGLVFLLVSAQLARIAPDCDRGIDIAIRCVMLVLIASWSHARWSVDAWIRRRLGRPFPDQVPAWPRYLLFLQLLWIYFSSGHGKTGVEWYWNGEFAALANVLSDPHFARFDSAWVPYVYELTQAATVATMAFELGAPLMILFTWWHATRERPGRLRRWSNTLRLRWVWIGLAVTFHLGIATFMKLGIFPWGMLAIFPVLFHPDELDRAWAWITRRAAGRWRPTPRPPRDRPAA